MVGSTRAELASSGLEGSSFASAFPNGQRGAYSGSHIDRLGSFRESLESRLMASGPMASRNAAASADVSLVTQFMSLEPFPTNELKNVRSGELRRVLGISVEDHSFGSLQSKPLPPISWDELKRFRGNVEETRCRAKERGKSLQNSLVKLDKVRNIVSKKRQRSGNQFNEKSSSSNLLKIGSQMHQNPPDFVGQRVEERTKNGVLNKRIRSSIAEVRASLPCTLQPEGQNNLPMRQGSMLDKDKNKLIDKDKNMLRACNGYPVSTDDKMPGLPAGSEGWDKKNKRKRSVGTMVNRPPPDGDREHKQATQQKPSYESRPRSGDGLCFRTESPNGSIGSNRMDGSSQVSGGGSRIIPRNDLSNESLSNDRKERFFGLDKERTSSKGSNKVNMCDDAQVGTQSPLTKGKAARAPRTGSGIVINMPSFPCSSGGIDGLEHPSLSNKVLPLTGASNRKRPLPTGSSSPPVAARWGGTRREKISRTRRANVVSPVSNLDDTQNEGSAASDFGAKLSSMDSSGISNRGIPNNFQLNSKPDNVSSPAAPSESEESGALESKSKAKGIGNSQFENGTVNVAHRTATFGFPTKKNKVLAGEEIGDGVRRQGRSGRGSMQSRVCIQLSKEKLESSDAAKPLKSGRLISDKTESRIGRPSSKKASDRKGSTRPVQVINGGSSDLAGESDDDHEELLAAAKYVRRNGCLEHSGPFWKKIEPIFASVSSEDFGLLKHQINIAKEIDGSFSGIVDADYTAENASQAVPSPMSQQFSQTNLVGLKKCDGTACSADEQKPFKATSGEGTERLFNRRIPLLHKLLSAFILEDGSDMIDNNVKRGDRSLQFSSDCSAYGECGSDLTSYKLELDNDLGSQTSCNGFSSSGSTFRCPSMFISGEELLQENDDLAHPANQEIGTLCELELHKSNNQEEMNMALSGTSPHQCQYEHMSLDDRILLELQSIGIYPDAETDLAGEYGNEVDEAVSELRIRLYQQVKEKKNQLCKLEKAIQAQKECEMRNLDQLAMDKLVEMAYTKLMAGGGRASHKGGASKISKPLAMAFAKRTLARCRKYEETGQSCFGEPFYRDVLFSEPVHNIEAKNIDGITSGIASNVHVELHTCEPASRVSASGLSSNVIERNGASHKIDRSRMDPHQGLTQFSEQPVVRNDPISNRGKKREVLLDDVVSGAASRAAPNFSSTLAGCVKWKKTDNDHSIDPLTKNSAPKDGSPSQSTGRGERKTKAKPKQKIAQLSTSGNGLGRITEKTIMLSSMQDSCENLNPGSSKLNADVELAGSSNAQDLSKEIEDNIFTNLPLQGIDSIDGLDVTDGLGGQGQDIGSWLNVDDDALQDNDLVGLEIPMDDLSELKLNF
ncbi:uncharacterized protein LOC109824683 [Asparagus officinalis]|uniref:uncharacterized protein LOC109824683 n=1 Tax=Asparagus officinalis TaxID=4686 RepID=UPI00098E49AC|nr:uncharacterized protein LOC109824683 [Asparagus officinalis]